jgi:hypothetical protein
MLTIISNKRWPTPRAIAETLGARHVRLNRPFVRRRRAETLVNWGCSNLGDYRDWARGGNLLNSPAAVAVASNKLRTFQALQRAEVPTLDWTDNLATAQGWVRTDRKSVIGHFNLSAHSGQGLRVFRREEADVAHADFTGCKVWTKFFPRDREFRVHIFQDKVFVNEKKRAGAERIAQDFGRERADYWVRNHQTGWVYVRDVPAADADRVSALARAALRACGLDFGAVDIFWGAGGRGAAPVLKVCEVNSAPGLAGETLAFYTAAIVEAANNE